MADCIYCDATGSCQPCKGSGRSGYFLVKPTNKANACWRCKGSGRCVRCYGLGQVGQTKFRPYIYVQGSRTTPTSITCAAFSGATWRYLDIPFCVSERSPDAQRGYVAWRVQTHYRSMHGECWLFGKIVRYWWRRSEDVSVAFDRHGRIIVDRGSSLTQPNAGQGDVAFRTHLIKQT